jgi:2-phosphosulfolactate phosphatase
MDIVRTSLLPGARQAQGITVIIDVLRAFSSAAFMLHLGAEKIVLLAEPEEVLALRGRAGYLAVGEVDGIPVPGFDLGNSPSQILAAGPALFAGRAVALRSSAGVRGALAASPRSEQLYLGSYVTARATSRFIQGLSPAPRVLTLVAMGDGGRETTPDDEHCADYIEHLLGGRHYDHIAALREIVGHRCTTKFLDG